jgi:hypothetical protein
MGKILTNQMVHILVVKTTTLVQTSMLKSTSLKWQNDLTPIQIGYFLLNSPIKKTKNSTSKT